MTSLQPCNGDCVTHDDAPCREYWERVEMQKFLCQCEADYMKCAAFYALSDTQIKALYTTYPRLLSYIRKMEKERNNVLTASASYKTLSEQQQKRIERLERENQDSRKQLEVLSGICDPQCYVCKRHQEKAQIFLSSLSQK